ncbi:hypothetical protein FRUB_05176 [Fimbriiglobus ruber]|uniref:Uncharacterized protein n=1 Tax=Fimbriiglobus ruber TaxID=1908690 RepID=A0A225DVP1_9BACT|nr:hypothetical protein FRUB_05176 [Fimbriiglobus ruber]
MKLPKISHQVFRSSSLQVESPDPYDRPNRAQSAVIRQVFRLSVLNLKT